LGAQPISDLEFDQTLGWSQRTAEVIVRAARRIECASFWQTAVCAWGAGCWWSGSDGACGIFTARRTECASFWRTAVCAWGAGCWWSGSGGACGIFSV